MKRKDVHSESNLRPDDYRYVAFIHPLPNVDPLRANQDERAMIAQQDKLINMYRERGAKIHGGIFSCDHCGAHYKWGAMFEHKHTRELLSIGWQCEERRFGLNNAQYERARVEKLIATAKARRGRFAKLVKFCREHREELRILNLNRRTERDNFLLDLRAKLHDFCSLSDAQLAWVSKAYNNAVARREQREAEDAEPKKPVPVTEDRVKVEGTVLGTRSEDTQFGYQTKMLVKCDGFKLWGTMPSQLLGVTEKGDKVEFMAKIQRSDKDENFGFFSRPTKAVNHSENERAALETR